jgi:hypothetical protein
MAAGHTVDTRTHVMGDMLMLTGTFFDGGTSVSFDGLLSTVFAAGGHVTSSYDTGVTIDEADGIDVGETEITVDTVSALLHFNLGEDVYDSVGRFMGTVGAVTATTITLTAGSLVSVGDDKSLRKLGPNNGSVTLVDGTLSVSIDETNSKVIFGNGNLGATIDRTSQTGRWWILGLR